MHTQGLCLSFPWSEVPGEPVQQCWRWLQLQGNTVTHRSSLHFVQTPGSSLSAGTSQSSWGSRDGCCSHRCGKKIIRLSWHLRALTCVCSAFSCRPDHVKVTVLLRYQAHSCLMPARTVKNKLSSHPTPARSDPAFGHMESEWLVRLSRDSKQSLVVVWLPHGNRAKRGQQTCDQSKLSECLILSMQGGIF